MSNSPSVVDGKVMSLRLGGRLLVFLRGRSLFCFVLFLNSFIDVDVKRYLTRYPNLLCEVVGTRAVILVIVGRRIRGDREREGEREKGRDVMSSMRRGSMRMGIRTRRKGTTKSVPSVR